MMKKYVNLLFIIFAFVAGSIVSSSIPVVLAHGGNVNLIHGCIRNNGLLAGFIRIVGASTNCNTNETSLDWNAEGLPGTGALVSNLHGAVINNTDFGWRTLKNADFSGAGCNLSHNTFNNHTDLTGVNFTDCVFDTTSFNNVNFTVITLGNNNFQNAFIGGSNLTNVNLSGDNLNGINVDSSNLTGASIANVQFDQSEVRFTNSNLTNANFSGILFTGLSNLELDNSNLTGTNFTGANFSALNFANFSGATGSNTNFTNADLRRAIGFDSATLTTPIWSNTTCPDGTNSNSNSGTCSGHGGGL